MFNFHYLQYLQKDIAMCETNKLRHTKADIGGFGMAPIQTCRRILTRMKLPTEIIVAKGEMAHYKELLYLPQ